MVPTCALGRGGSLRELARELGLDLESGSSEGGPGERVTVRGEFDEAGARAFVEESGLPWEAAEQLGVQFDRARCAIAFTWPGLEARKLRVHRSAEPRFVWCPAGADSRPSLWPRVGREAVTGTRVALTEGERDALALRALGLEAFSVTGGAGSPPSFEDLARLLALGVREFWVAYDADAAGLEGTEKCREAVYRVARHLGLRVKVRSLPLPGEVVSSGGKDWIDAIRLLGKEEVARRLHGAESPSRSAAQLLTAAELLVQAEEDTPWLVEGLLPAGGMSVLVAKPKVGKSTLARALAVAVAQGRGFLGRKVRQGPVLLLSLEERPGDVRRHLRQLGLKPEDPLLVAFDLGPKQLDQLRAWVEQHRPVLVVVDPLIRVVRVIDMAAYAEVARALEGLVDLAHASGAHVQLVHHAPKLGDDRSAVDAPLGTTAISGAVDVVLHLKRTPEGRRFLASVQRVGEDLPEVEVTLGTDGWPSLGRSREEVDEARVLGSILEFVEANPGATRAEVLEGVPGSQNLKVRVLHRLVQEGRLVCAGTGKRGDPFRYTLGSVSVLRTDCVASTENTETPSGLERASDLAESRTRFSAQIVTGSVGVSTEFADPGEPDPQGDSPDQGTCPRCGEPEVFCCCPGPDPGPGPEAAQTLLAPQAPRTCLDCGAPLPPDNLVRCEPCVARAWQEFWGEPPRSGPEPEGLERVPPALEVDILEGADLLALQGEEDVPPEPEPPPPDLDLLPPSPDAILGPIPPRHSVAPHGGSHFVAPRRGRRRRVFVGARTS
ncbi:MAG: AAA family ATPase [Armatimonadota bacterium]|nr:AAA family ATPase [Armatimonadota bacterium]